MLKEKKNEHIVWPAQGTVVVDVRSCCLAAAAQGVAVVAFAAFAAATSGAAQGCDAQHDDQDDDQGDVALTTTDFALHGAPCLSRMSRFTRAKPARSS